MRLVTWNCQGGLHRKIAAIEALEPDLAIIQECECPDRLRSRAEATLASAAHRLVRRLAH